MKFGVSTFPTDNSIRPDELARLVESFGFESLWFPEHSHIPTSRQTPWGGVEGAPPLPDIYWRSYDQTVALSYAAAVTTTLRLGTGISLVAQRDPIWTAKEIASLDHLSEGRVIFGIGYGWNKEEMASHGVDYRQRRQLLREKILLMKSLWSDDEAAYNGDLLRLEPSWAWPKPYQRPHPPIILGGAAGPKTRADMVEFCDGWMPLVIRHDIVGQIATLRSELEAAGRDPEQFEITASGAKPDQMETLAAAGVTRVIFNLPSAGSDVVVPKLKSYAETAGL